MEVSRIVEAGSMLVAVYVSVSGAAVETIVSVTERVPREVVNTVLSRTDVCVMY